MMEDTEGQTGGTPDNPPKKGRADHLKPYWWKKGQSGNPKGPTKGNSISREMKKLLESIYHPDDLTADEIAKGRWPKGGVTGYQRLARALYEEAVRGDRLAIKDIQDRDEGKVPDVVDLYQTGDERPRIDIPDMPADGEVDDSEPEDDTEGD